nr:hypothetical protein [Sedimentibacter sp.]
MKYTANYNLKKPEGTDTVNIDDLNNNADILDTEINSINEQIDTLTIQDNSFREQINNLDANKADLVDGKVPSEQLPTINVPVQSVNNKTGVVVLTKSDIGLESVDNTADSVKNVLSATKLATARAINGVQFNGTANITIADGTKAPIAHASTGTEYGIGTPSNYGHVKTVNVLTQSTHVDGTALSAYQGKLLYDKIALKSDVFSLVRTLNTNISAPVAVPLIESDFTDYDEVLLVLRGSISMTSSYNLEQFTIGLGQDLSSTEIYLLQHFVPNSTTVSRTLKTITSATISDKYFSNEKVWSRAIGSARISGGNFVVRFNTSRITASGTVYLDIYRRKII